MTRAWMLIAGLALVPSALAAPAALDGLLDGYRAAGAGAPDPARGAAAWIATHPGPDGAPRSCATCHGTDPRGPGKHATTGEPLGPMALSVDPTRYSDAANVEKWFGRNCRWTLGRECTPQEKADFLAYLAR